MSGNGTDNTPCGTYGAFSTEELENMLRLAMLSENELDMERIDPILLELERRGACAPSMSPEAALREFLDEYAGRDPLYPDCAPEADPAPVPSVPRQPRRRRFAVKALLTAAALVVLLLATMLGAQAAGIDAFGFVAELASKVFTPPTREEVHEALVENYDGPEILTELMEQLVEHDVPLVVLPNYLPEEFVLAAPIVEEMPNQTSIECWLYKTAAAEGLYDLQICYTVHNSASSAGIYDREKMQLYETNGLQFYVRGQSGWNYCTAAWIFGRVECRISGSVSYEEMLRILDSIGI